MWLFLCVFAQLLSVATAAEDTVILEELVANLETFGEKLQTCEDNHLALGEKYKTLELNSNEKISELLKVIESQKTEIQDVKKTVDKINKTKRKLASLPENVESIRKTLKSHETNADALTAELTKLKTTLGKQNKESVASVKESVNKLKSDHESTMGEVSQTIKSLKAQIAANNKLIESQQSTIKDLNEQHDATKRKLEQLETEGVGNDLVKKLNALQEIIVDSYAHVTHDLLIRMGFSEESVEEGSRQLKEHYATTCAKLQVLIDHGKVYGAQGADLALIYGEQAMEHMSYYSHHGKEFVGTVSDHAKVYYNQLAEEIPVWTESISSNAKVYYSLATEHGAEYATVIGQKASELTVLAKEKANEISLEDIKKSSMSVAESAQTNYQAGKDYVKDNFPQVKQVFEEAKVQVTGLGVTDDPANVELILDVTILFSMLIITYIFLKLTCCLLCGSCSKSKAAGKKKQPQPASPEIVEKVENAKQALKKKKKTPKKEKEGKKDKKKKGKKKASKEKGKN